MAKKEPTPAEVQAAIGKLRKYHQLGRQLSEEHEPGARRWADMRGVCKQYRLLAHQVRTLRKFANPKTGYTEPALDQLCTQCQQHGRVVGLTAISHLLKIDDKRKRFQIQSKMIHGDWPDPRIVAELKRELKRPWKGGRKPYVADDAAGVLLQLQGFAVAWRRWSERFADADEDKVTVRPSDLDPEVQAAMRTVTKSFASLSAKVSRQMEEADGNHHGTGREWRSKAKTQLKRP
ncbi:MAG: hypothetical protein NTY19_06335 [Planctomycetota bacterium]|nr:hypothetical protein [Planctomycetota bacterium]